MSQNNVLPRLIEDILQTIGLLIQSARKEARYTSAEIALRAGVSRRTITRLEKGDPGISLGLFINVLWLLDIPLLRGMDIGNRQARSQISLLLLSLDRNQAQRVRHPSKGPYG